MSELFRKADIADEKDGASILSLLARFAEESSFPRSMPESTKETLVANLKEFPTTRIFFVEIDTVPVGIAVCFLLFSTFNNAPVLNLHDLYICKEYQGNGIGKRFIRYLEDEARSMKCSRINLEVYDSNKRAMHLYESLGYESGPNDKPDKVMYALSKLID